MGACNDIDSDNALTLYTKETLKDIRYVYAYGSEGEISEGITCNFKKGSLQAQCKLYCAGEVESYVINFKRENDLYELFDMEYSLCSEKTKWSFSGE